MKYYNVSYPEALEQLGKPLEKKRIEVSLPAPPSYLTAELVRRTLRLYEENFFYLWFKSIVGDTANLLFKRYQVGTSSHWKGACVFWQIDQNNMVHGGKIMLYNQETGKRVKEPFPHITWVHRVLNLKSYNLQQCLFGEHLLKNNELPVIITESEKSALLGAAMLPSYLWLACGGLNNLTSQKLGGISQKITLMPDSGGFDLWNDKCMNFRELGIKNITCSGRLESEEKGFDIGDLLLRDVKPQAKFTLKELADKLSVVDGKMYCEGTPPDKLDEEAQKFLRMSTINPELINLYKTLI